MFVFGLLQSKTDISINIHLSINFNSVLEQGNHQRESYKSFLFLKSKGNNKRLCSAPFHILKKVKKELSTVDRVQLSF